MSTRITEHSVRGMTFRCREAGEAGEPVILLHGFPETSAMWLDLIERLAAAGYRCLAPDQRGYSPAARPEGAERYALPELSADVIALADDAGFGRFHLIGHDWGSAAGWAVAAQHPDRLLSWTALSVPHLRAFREAIHGDSDQTGRSGYMSFFRQVGAAEDAMSKNDLAGLRNLWSIHSEETLADYVSVFSQPGALTGALNWYRAPGGFERPDEGAAGEPVSVPTLFIWGNQDQAIGRVAAEAGERHASGPYRFVELNAGHWLAQQEPERVASEILEHLGKFGAAS